MFHANRGLDIGTNHITRREFCAGTAISGSRAFVALGEMGVAIVDLSKPDQPAVVARIDVIGQVLGIAVDNGVIYVAAAHGGLVMMRL